MPITQASKQSESTITSADELSLQTPVPESDSAPVTTSPANNNSTLLDEISIAINNLEALFNRELKYSSMDTITHKQEGAFRLIFQNPNGIKIYQEKDPEYLQSMKFLKEHKAGIICLAETNIPWHKSLFFYDVTKQNQATWSGLPTKTVAASCRNEKKTVGNYLPGGVLTVVTDTMTTKIKNVESDPLGRWTKIIFFAIKGTVSAYNIYRPNKSSIKSAGGDTVWIQQHRALLKEKGKQELRSQLIQDLIADSPSSNKQGNNEVILAGDYNEDPRDN